MHTWRLRLFIDLMLLSDEPRMQCRYLINSIDRLERSGRRLLAVAPGAA